MAVRRPRVRLAGQEPQTSTEMVPVVRLDKVSKNYGTTPALQDVTMTVGRGDVYGLIGRNGAGKTTLMKLVLGLSELSEGTLSINGSVGAAETNAQRASIGYLVGQSFFGRFNARDNLEFFRRIKGISDRMEVSRVLE